MSGDKELLQRDRDLEQGTTGEGMTRQPSSADIGVKKTSERAFNQADMKLAQKLKDTNAESKEAKDDHHEELDKDHTIREGFTLNEKGLTEQEADALLKRYGLNQLPEKVIPKWYIFISMYWQPMPLMIWAAIIIEGAIQNWPDMGILIGIQFVNGSIGFYETVKAGDAVAALKASLKPSATVKRDGQWKTINATLVVPGDTVLLASGSAIPADCRVNHGEIDVDQAALTGESLPVTMYKMDSCKMGSTVVRGETEGTVEFTGANTFFGKTAALLGGTGEVSNLQKFLMKIMTVLVVLSVTLCVINFVYLYEETKDATTSLSFTIVLLVASIPLAIEIVTTTTLALGSRGLSKHGAIVSRLAAIEDLAGMAILCSDKTGTLTLNKMMIQSETPVYRDGETQYSLLRFAAMAAKWKEPPKDALDTLVLGAVDLPSMDSMEMVQYVPFDPIFKRTEGTVRDKNTGEVFKATKGAPHVLMKIVESSNPNPALKTRIEADVLSLGDRGIRAIAVARTFPGDDNTWHMLGLLTFLDPPRPDTKQTIADARENGVNVKMITGDHLLIARNMAQMLDLGDMIHAADTLPLLDEKTKKKPENLSRDYGDMCLASDGFAQVFPEHKYLIVECLRELGYKTGMTGDGVNDAPALKRADVGIAVQGATDAARAAADIILTEPGLSTIVHGIIIARQVFMRIRNFITYRIAATLQLLVFFFIAVFAFHPNNYQSNFPQFFHMPVLMLMLITLLNDGTLISIGYDNVIPLKTPMVWNLSQLFFIGSILAGVACASSLLLLYLLLSSNDSTKFMAKIGLGNLPYGSITTSIYLKVSISDFLTLFSSRTGGNWFWTSRPANILYAAASLALSMSLILALSWPDTTPDGIVTTGLARNKPYQLFVFIILYCLAWWFIQDGFKVYAYKVMEQYNWFNVNETGQVRYPPSTLKWIEDHRKEMAANKGKPTSHH